MPVLGADPDAPEKEWAEPGIRVYASKPVNELTRHFAYHPNMTMSQRCNDQDKVILNRHFSRALKKGYTVDTLKGMVDRFYQSWGGEYDAPVYGFVSRKMQNLLEQEAEVVKDDPVLQWLLHGMPNKGPFEDNAEMRKCVLLHAGDALHIYPEVVADTIRNDDTYAKTAEALLELASLPPTSKRPKYETVHQAIAAIPFEKKRKYEDDYLRHTD